MIRRILKHTLLITVTMLIAFKINDVYAASGSISITTSKSSVIVGETVTATVTVSSSTPIGAWEFSLNYDTSMLQLTSTQHKPHIVDYVSNSNTKSVSYTYTFKTLKTGNTNLSVANASLYGWDEQEMQLTAGSKTISIVNKPVVKYSSNNYLSSLSVEGYSFEPAFNKDVLSYNLEVENGVEKIKISATKEDSTAIISGTGEVSLTEGMNKIEIKVTAENGNVKTYTVNVLVKEIEPINVTVNGEEYSIIQKIKDLQDITIPIGYVESKININDKVIPAFSSEVTNITLVALKNKEGVINLYKYNQENNNYELYTELSFNKITLYIKELKNNIAIPTGYNKTTITINDIEVEAYKLKQDSKFSLIYGMNTETGEENLYMYDSLENTIQRYNNETIKQDKSINDFMVIIICLSAFSILSIILIIALIIRNKNIIKKIAVFEENLLKNKPEN